MASKTYTIPKGSLILVTGANSYIGSHIVDFLLELGYNVRGTVRAPKPWLNELFEKKFGSNRFETVIIPVLEKEGALDNTMSGVSGIVHVASDTSLNPDPNEVIPNVTKGVRNILEAASKQPSIKRFVLTSSSSAAYFPNPSQKVIITEETWNEVALQAAYSAATPPEQKPFIVYAASKLESERAAWEWFKHSQPKFEMNTVVPCMNIGQILSPEIPASTMGITRKLLENDDTAFKLLPSQSFVDVRDTARLHVIALLDLAVTSERIFACGVPYKWADVVAIFRKARPHRQVPNPPKDDAVDLSVVEPGKRAEELLKSFYGKSGWTKLEDSLLAAIVDIE
ncbi:hypothetical protein TRIATDRAFT_217087 [Trichoderma atroviride IMI 206040]|uniref:NAD-dependent epimerase/dehydratase domain-containing protein n=1 Tax=Hypocrea atroviridis (strain ATCC 20476 / IMI 206040) TaxID=452589 RepID=G9NP61_HYPAI|nr:uncharacterized protein TRIATDRAFT_217087 [Trichoderma atroviride IMI 206040]EHK47846.1 hypothetical protein TRIATDRAFT_217087 [Trichoderma atroviride IMI 206040]